MKIEIPRDSRKAFRIWTQKQCSDIEKCTDIEEALGIYASALSAVGLISDMFPDEPLELPLGNLKTCLEIAFDNYVGKYRFNE